MDLTRKPSINPHQVIKGKVNECWKDNRWFFIPYLFFLFCSVSLLLAYDKKNLHSLLSNFGNPGLDGFFSYLTYLGDGYTAVLISFILLFYRYGYALTLIISHIISASLVQILKHFVFSDMERPLRYFEGMKELRLVPGVDLHSYYSFPSGHATTAFVIFSCLSFFTKNKVLKLCYFCIAMLTAYSRVYLSQHFLSDICAGSVLGVAASACVFIFLGTSEKFNRMNWPGKKLELR